MSKGAAGRGRRVGRLLALPLLLALPACQAVSNVEAAMRRVDVLDRIFEPNRYGATTRSAEVLPLPPPVPPQPPTQAAAEPEPVAVEAPDQVKDPEPAPDTLVTAEPLPEPLPEPVVTAQAPRRDPAVRTAALLRDNPWLARFWGELTAAQQGRVQRALARRGLAGPDPAGRWDPMGLSERVSLVFGDGA